MSLLVTEADPLSQASGLSVPQAALTGTSIYRLMGPVRDDGLIGCGFLRKPDGEDGQAAGASHFSAVLVLRGHGRYRSAAGRWNLGPGSLFMRFPRVPHELRIAAGGGWAECWIALSVSLARALAAYGLIDRRRPVLRPGIGEPWIRDLLQAREALEKAADAELPAHLLRLQGLLFQVLAPVADDIIGRHRPAIDEACRRLMAEPRTDVRRLARDLGFSYERFRKVFRAATGLGPGDYGIRRRMERARTLLMDAGTSVQSVAAELGYANAFAFSAHFRKLVGTSPTAYRRRLIGTTERRPAPAAGR